MTPLSPADLTAMREAQAAAMMDACIVERRTSVPDAWGGEMETWLASAPVPCGFDPTSPVLRERRRADGTVAVIEALLRLRLEDAEGLDGRDRVRITARSGQPLVEPWLFGLDGPPEPGRTCAVCRLMRVE